MRRSRILVVALLVLVCELCDAQQIPIGPGNFIFIDSEGNADRPITVWTYRPSGFRADGKVVFVMHGRGRNGQDYRDAWIKYSEDNHFLLLAPEFSEHEYPSEPLYQQGFTRTPDGKVRDKNLWSLTAIERLFDHVIRENGLMAQAYSIYGHSGGGQFVHRLILLCPEARVERAISANSGWYSMPDLHVNYPYGLKGMPTDEEQLQKSFRKPMIILLGENDVDPNHPSLRRTPEALAQGKHRFERGKAFFRTAKRYADELNADLNWRVETVPGVDHSNEKMAPAAAALLQ